MSIKKLIRNLIIFAIIGAWTIWPLVLITVAGAIASANNCTLHEGFVNPCVVNGRDMGETLYSMGVSGWFMLVTIPTGLLAFGVFLLLLLLEWGIGRARARRRAEAALAPPATLSVSPADGARPNDPA